MRYFELLIKLRKIVRSVNLESKKIEKEFGVSIPQLLILQYLADQPDYKSTASKIKQYINLNASTVSGIISRLVRKGHVVKAENLVDHRSTDIVLTAKGSDFISHAPVTQQEKLTNKLKKLSAAEVDELTKNIDLLIDIMDLNDMDAGPILMTGEISEHSI